MSSFIQRSMYGVSLANMNANRNMFSKFNKAWPRTWSNGHECYSDKLVFYKEDWSYSNGETIMKNFYNLERNKKFLNVLGIDITKLTDPDYDEGEIDEAYFTFSQPNDRGTAKLSFSNIMSTYQSTRTENLIGKKIVVKFDYGGKTKTYMDEDFVQVVRNTYGTTKVSRPMEPPEIRGKIIRNPKLYIVATNSNRYYKFKKYIVTNGHDDKVVDDSNDYQTMAHRSFSNKLHMPVCTYEGTRVYLAHDNNNNGISNREDVTLLMLTAIFDVDQKNFSRTYGSIIENGNNDGFTFDVTYTLEHELKSSSPCIIDTLQMFNYNKEGIVGERYLDFSKTISIIDKKLSAIHSSVYPKPDVKIDVLRKDGSGIFDKVLLWTGGHMTVEGARRMNRQEWTQEFTAAFDSDTDVREIELWEKILAGVVLVIAAILVIWSGGALLAGGAAAIGFAGGLLAAAGIVLTIGGVVLAKFGGPSASNAVRIIGAFAEIVGYFGMVLGMYAIVQSISDAITKKLIENAIKEAGKEAAKEGVKAATEEAIEAALREALKQGTISTIEVAKAAFDVALDSLSSALSLAGKSALQKVDTVITWADNAFQVYQYYDQNFGETAKINEQIDEANKELDEIKEANEKNAPSRMDLAFGETFQTSFGSYDAIEELSKKIQFSMGGLKELEDPLAKLV